MLTEDNELTFAIRHLGYDVLSPTGCTLETEVMTSWHDLWSMVVRDKRGRKSMYNTIIPASSAGVLTFTGSSSLWYDLAAFALLAAGTAILRILPRRTA